MYPTLKDTKTGSVKDAGIGWDGSYWSWTDGNYGCDCNKALAFFGRDDEAAWKMQCGSTRFIAVDVNGDLEGYTKEDIIAEMNRYYPEAATNSGAIDE